MLFISSIFVYEDTVHNLDFICNFDNFRVIKQRKVVSIMLFKIDNSKYLFLENVEMVNCANVLPPYNTSIVNM